MSCGKNEKVKRWEEEEINAQTSAHDTNTKKRREMNEIKEWMYKKGNKGKEYQDKYVNKTKKGNRITNEKKKWM